MNAYEKLTAGIIEQLEAARASGGVAPWQKPWSAGADARPYNPFTKTVYSGINNLILQWSGKIDLRFATFNQIRAAKGSVKKGAKGFAVCYYGTATKENENDSENPSSFRFLRTYYVFSIEDTEGLNLPPVSDPVASTIPLIDRCERIVKGYHNGPRIAYNGGNSAFYRPSTDSIHLPTPDSFISSEHYYGTLFHELSHSTGNKSRLDRLEKDGLAVLWGDDVYSKEELIAELSAYFLCNKAQISGTVKDNQASYLNHWINVINGDPKILISAASAAQKSADYILGTRS